MSKHWSLALVLVLGGCSETRSTFFVRQVQDLDDECTATSDSGGDFRTSGLLDVLFLDGAGNPPDYQLHPLLENQMVARVQDENLRPESNGIQVDGAVVRIYETDDPDVPPEETAPVLEFFSYSSSYVEPANRGVTGFTVIPAEYTRTRYEELCGMPINTSFGNFDFNDYEPRRSLVLVGVVVQGLTNGGLAVETPEFLYPVDLCCGCLLSCPIEADLSDVPGPDCCDSAAPEETVCNGGQDDAVDCRFCRGSLASPLVFELCGCGTPVCPAG